MNLPHTQSLLRRTAVAIAAVAASLFTLPVAALNMSLPGGGNCTSPVIATQPDGSLSLTCGSTAPNNPPPGPPTIYLSNTYNPMPLSAAADGVNGDPPAAGATPISVFVNRTNTTTGDLSVYYNISGQGCYANGFPPPASGVVQLTGSALQSPAIGLVNTYPGSQCNIVVYQVTPASGGTIPSLTLTGITATQQPNYVTIPVSLTLGGGGTGGGGGGGGGGGTVGPGNVPIVAGCPTPTNATMFTMPATPGAHPGNQPNFPNGSLVFPSGVVGAAPLPATLMVSGVQHAQAQLELTYSAFSPANVIDIEMAISHCPGVIDATGVSTMNSSPYCYYHSNNTADLTLTWVGKLVNGFTPAMQAANVSRCYALEGDQNLPWYANVRYTYTGNCYSGDCGEQFQWNDSSP